MIEINEHNIENYIEEFRKVLGDDFINEIDSFETLGLKKHEADRTESTAHPFALWWRAYKQDIIRIKDSGRFGLSVQSSRALEMLSNLIDIKNIPNVQRIKNSIRNKGTFFSGIFEAYIAAGYLFQGFSVEAVEEQPGNKQKTTDLHVKVGSQIIYVECKSLDDFAIKESKHWQEILDRVSCILRNHKKNWGITILCGKQIDDKDKQSICNEIAIDIKKNNLGLRRLENKKIIIQYEKLSEWDQVFTGSLIIPKRGEHVMLDAEVIRETDGMKYKNCRIIEVKPHVELDVTNRLVSEIKKAARQVPKEGPGIIHIAIPHKVGSQLLDVTDSSYLKIFKILNRNSQRVNSVVITGSVLDNNHLPLTYHHYVIPNMITRSELLSDFSILGANDTGISLPDKAGKIHIAFTLSEDWDKNKPAYIYNYCSKNGKYQFRIWRTWSDKLRIDLVTPSNGRIFLESNIGGFVPNKQNYFDCIWNEDEIKIYLNGEIKESKKVK